jgi:hypothetical protein
VQRTDRIVLHHAQRTMHARSHKGSVVARHGHRDEAHHDGAGFRCEETLLAEVLRDPGGNWGSLARRRSSKRIQIVVEIVTGGGSPFFAIVTV